MDQENLNKALDGIMGPLGPLNGAERKERAIEAIRTLSDKASILILAVTTDEAGTEHGQCHAQMADEQAKTACLEYLRKIGCIPKGQNALLDSLRSMLPPGHPLRDDDCK